MACGLTLAVAASAVAAGAEEQEARRGPGGQAQAATRPPASREGQGAGGKGRAQGRGAGGIAAAGGPGGAGGPGEQAHHAGRVCPRGQGPGRSAASRPGQDPSEKGARCQADRRATGRVWPTQFGAAMFLDLASQPELCPRPGNWPTRSWPPTTGSFKTPSGWPADEATARPVRGRSGRGGCRLDRRARGAGVEALVAALAGRGTRKRNSPPPGRPWWRWVPMPPARCWPSLPAATRK